MSLYPPFKAILWLFCHLAARVRVEGTENIPRKGPFLLLSNHQSILDPIFVQAHCPRTVHSMTKSTQFAKPLFRWVLPRVHGFPTRRYRVDPQAVRVALRLLKEGKGVGIYPEGERSWDSVLQPFRPGSVRLALKAGVPVILAGISGSYDVWPRWSRRIRRAPVTIRFGKPILFGAHDRREERERTLPEATRTIEEALRHLSRHEPSGGP